MHLTSKRDERANDASLLLRVKQGDEGAFSLLYYRHSEMLYNLAFRYLKGEDLAQDAVQQTFVRFWESRKEVTIKSSLSNYLYTMTKNYVLNQIRHNDTVIAHHYEIAQGRRGVFEDVSEELEKKERLEKFHEALQKLPERSRKICLMKLQGDMSNDEIAATLCVSTSTVKTDFKQAKDFLRQYLGKIFVMFLFHRFS